MAARERRLSPIHPGEILLEEFMKPLKHTTNRLALDLRVPGTRIHAIVNTKRDITPAMRLARYVGTTVEVWLNLQMRYDLENAEYENRRKSRPGSPPMLSGTESVNVTWQGIMKPWSPTTDGRETSAGAGSFCCPAARIGEPFTTPTAYKELDFRPITSSKLKGLLDGETH
jgi:addiction module HigA family antidote